jgi:hypothetical protein
MRPKLQKRSALKLIGRIILHKQGYNIPQLAAESVSKACFGIHTRNFLLEKLVPQLTITIILRQQNIKRLIA